MIQEHAANGWDGPPNNASVPIRGVATEDAEEIFSFNSKNLDAPLTF